MFNSETSKPYQQIIKQMPFVVIGALRVKNMIYLANIVYIIINLSNLLEKKTQ